MNCRKPSTAKPKRRLLEIWMAETKAQAEKAFDRFMRDFGAKYPTATGVLIKDRVVLLSAVGTLPDVTQDPMIKRQQ